MQQPPLATAPLCQRCNIVDLVSAKGERPLDALRHLAQRIAPPYADVQSFPDALLLANPARLLWGSDWPHVMVKDPLPHDADLCDLMGDWVHDAALRRQVFVDNPTQLYGF